MFNGLMAIIPKSAISINANTFKSRKNENNEIPFLVVLETTITYLVDFSLYTNDTRKTF